MQNKEVRVLLFCSTVIFLPGGRRTKHAVRSSGLLLFYRHNDKKSRLSVSWNWALIEVQMKSSLIFSLCRNSAEEQWLPFGESWRNEQLRLSLERGSSNLLVSCCNQFEISLRSPQGRGFLLCSCMSFPRCNTEYLKQCSLCRTLYCTKHQKRGSAKEVRRTSNNHPPPLCLQRRFYINMWWCRNSPDSS